MFSWSHAKRAKQVDKKSPPLSVLTSAPSNSTSHAQILWLLAAATLQRAEDRDLLLHCLLSLPQQLPKIQRATTHGSLGTPRSANPAMLLHGPSCAPSHPPIEPNSWQILLRWMSVRASCQRCNTESHTYTVRRVHLEFSPGVLHRIPLQHHRYGRCVVCRVRQAK